MLDALITVLLEKLVPLLLKQCLFDFTPDRKLKALEKNLKYVQGLQKDINKMKIDRLNESLKTVQRALENLLLDAKDVLDLFDYMYLRNEDKKTISFMKNISIFSAIRYCEIGMKLGSINKEITILQEKLKAFANTALICQEPAQGGHSRLHMKLMNDDELVGLEKAVETLTRWISEGNGELKIIAIVGMGGIGKTTLARKLYDEQKGSFTKSVFLTVSQTVDLVKIIKFILKELAWNGDWTRNDEHWLLTELRSHLEGGKYFFIFDDVWQIDLNSWWDSLKSALPTKNNGSCIIVTTRKKNVATSIGAASKHIHEHKPLSTDTSWLLFSKKVFPRGNPDKKLESVGKEIVRKFGGLPLAINIVGGMMKYKEDSVYEWEQTFVTLKDELASYSDGSKLIIKTLQVSYEDLPPHLQQCMLYFAFFPEDFQIQMEEVIHLWTTEDCITKREGKTAYEVGEECFHELINRGLLLGMVKDIFERRFMTCKVHDMIRDMIMEVAKEKQFLGFIDSAENNVSSLSLQSRRAGITGSYPRNVLERTSLKLRVLVGRNIDESSDFVSDMKVLSKRESLRILDLSFNLPSVKQTQAEEWLSKDGTLPLLNYLKIKNSNSERLPGRNLRNLQVLYIQCYKLKILPAQLSQCYNLLILNLFGCDFLECLPSGIENLSNLEQLWGFKPASAKLKRGCHIKSLRKLTRLRRLWILIDSDDQLEEGDFEVLSDLKELKLLGIEFRNKNHEIKEEALRKMNSNQFTPLERLYELNLHSWPGEETPRWLTPSILPKLQFLHIYEGNFTSIYPGFFGQPNANEVWDLKGLVLQDLLTLEGEWPQMKEAMPSLRLLKIEQCYKLKSLPFPSVFQGTWRK